MNVRQRPIVVVGSINMDLVVSADRIPVGGETILGSSFQTHPGGKGANQAVAAARLGYPVQMIGRVGADEFGQQLRASLIDAGVDISGVITSDGASGVAIIAVAKGGQNSIVIVPGVNALLMPTDLDANMELLRGAGMVLAQLEVPLETIEHLARICRREAIPLMLDPAPAKLLPDELLRSVDWLTPNETEAAFYASSEHIEPPEMAKRLLAKGARCVVLKLGSRGAYLASREGLDVAIASFPTSALDTTAAGDCFNGAFATGLLMRKAPAEAARFAAAASAISVRRQGAQSSMPALAEVEELLRSG